MAAYDETGEQMLQIDSKRAQRNQNYRRAEAFLLWKFGPMWDEAQRFLRGSGMDWPSLFVEFMEKVEEDLLQRTRIIEEQHFKWMENSMTNPILVTSPGKSGTGILEQLEAKQKAFEDACSSGDVEAMKRLAPKGHTYGEVVKPHSQTELQRRIDVVNKERGH